VAGTGLTENEPAKPGTVDLSFHSWINTWACAYQYNCAILRQWVPYLSASVTRFNSVQVTRTRSSNQSNLVKATSKLPHLTIGLQYANNSDIQSAAPCCTMAEIPAPLTARSEMITVFLGPTRVFIPNRTSIRSAVCFISKQIVAARQTNKLTDVWDHR